jgi:2-amino-4-hydroxy-6-hydroxymethyldihydropteridine diphosphokinase
VTRAYVGLGSNLGDRARRLREAIAALAATPRTRVVAQSRVYETEPVGGPPQGPHLNAAVALDTQLDAAALLARLHEIERAAGRARSGERDAPRTLDLDLLLFGDERIDTPALVVPHPRMHERAFVLTPLAEIAPDAVHPRLGERIAALEARVHDERAVRPWREPE